MIIKHFPMQSVKKSNFAGLVQYITDKQGKFERIGVCSITNCIGDTIDDVIAEVLAVQQLNTRATSDKTYHLLVSFRPGENPDAAVLKTIEEKICSDLGYDEHQRVSVVHHDTDNIHLHIAINKIHPKNLTMREPFNAYRTFAKLSKTLEKEYGLEPDNHISQKSVSEGRAHDMERHSGIESLMTWIRKECLHKIRGAQSWAELHQVLSENGLELLERGNGLVFRAESGSMVKASTVARDISKIQLEKRLGPFQKSNENSKRPKQEYHKRPIKMRINTDELFLQYQKKTQENLAAKILELKKIKTRKKKKIEDALRSNRLQRATIKLMKGRFAKKLLYAKAYKNLHDKIQYINADFQKERQSIHDQFRCLTWLDWLKKEALSGNQEALIALRSRMMAQGMKGNTITGTGRMDSNSRGSHQFVVDNITKKGTKIIRLNQNSIRDDGVKIGGITGNNEEAIQKALQFAISLYGPCIVISGTNEFKNQTVRTAASSKVSLIFTDEHLEKLRQHLVFRGNKQHHKGMHQ
jgi:hypothetical protein